ncbi:MAG: DUF365 domain-containing protein [Candidatus Nanohaloarchaea archaeon]
MEDIRGVVFSLDENTIQRGIKEDKDVIANYTRKKKLKPGMDLYLYSSGDETPRKIVARAEIEKVERMKPNSVEEKYSDRLFPKKEEFKEYTKNRRNKEMLVLTLNNLIRLNDPVNPPGNMTVAGLYIDEGRYKRLKNKMK